MARRANAPIQKPNRVQVDGDWIDIRQTARFDEVMQMRQTAKDDTAAVFSMLALFAEGWSFLDEAGEMLPITPDNVRDNSDALVVVKAIGELQRLPFLEQMSRQMNLA